MADTALLTKLYANESDEQLIEKVLNKNSGLTQEALVIAKSELAKRNINLNELEIAHERKIEQKKNYEKFLSTKSDAELKELKDFVITEKLKSKTNEEITKDIEEKGVSRDISELFFEGVKEDCKNNIDSIWGDLFYGGVGTFLAILLAIWIYRISEGTRLFVAIGLIIAGLVKFSMGLMKLSVYGALKRVVRSFD
jgi:hypothetical protein